MPRGAGAKARREAGRKTTCKWCAEPVLLARLRYRITDSDFGLLDLPPRTTVVLDPDPAGDGEEGDYVIDGTGEEPWVGYDPDLLWPPGVGVRYFGHDCRQDEEPSNATSD